MKIALIGYGKMGRIIDDLALQAGHEVVARLGRTGWDDPQESWRTADVAIEFTEPHSGAANVRRLLEAGIPVVCGTTGWYEHRAEMEELCRKKQGKMVIASNFSIGVNVYFALAQRAAEWLKRFPNYRAAIHEIHHTAKVDAPSGTAKTLQERVHAGGWKDVPVTWERIDPAPGTHILTFSSEVDTLTLHHEAHSRAGFASGALHCAEQLVASTPGVYAVEELLFGE